MTRVHNFCAGPAALPQAVLDKAQSEMLNWQGSGMSIMEMSHRSAEFVSVAEKAENDLRDLLKVPDNYSVLFVQGGASTQFASIPLNLAAADQAVDYVNTGQWSKKAIKEAQRFANVNVVASSEDTNFSTIPDVSTWNVSQGAAYLHYTPNETIGGVEFFWTPEVDAPLVADMSSTILSRPINVSDYGMIYAGAQKNIGPAGLTIVIIRNDLLERAQPSTPTMLMYKTMADNGSMYNTPPSYSIYLAGLVFEWLKEQGGLEAMAQVNQRKAEKLYAEIDANPFYANPVEVASRSTMNVPFTLANPDLEKQFLSDSEAAGLMNLKGHRSVGGMRASIYNAVSEASVDALIEFMQSFAKQHG
ncbi:MAG: 3-phosphoserine/phosphohydroxythreonine transaminase [Pseudomonadota bacterium]